MFKKYLDDIRVSIARCYVQRSLKANSATFQYRVSGTPRRLQYFLTMNAPDVGVRSVFEEEFDDIQIFIIRCYIKGSLKINGVTLQYCVSRNTRA